MFTGAATMENSMVVPQQIKNRNTIQSSNSTFGYLSEEHENTNLNRHMHPHVQCSIICNSQVEVTYMSIDKGMYRLCGKDTQRNIT